jgi:uncharacterized protein
MLNKLKYIFLPLFIIFSFSIFYFVTALYPDVLWFESFGYESIWWFVFNSKIAVFLTFFFASFAIIFLNVKIALHLTSKSAENVDLDFDIRFTFIKQLFIKILNKSPGKNQEGLTAKLNKFVIYLLTSAFSLLLALNAKTWWQEIYLFLNRSSSNISDPIFEKNISFYFFVLPFIKKMHSWLTIVLILSILIICWIYISKSLLIHIFAKNIKQSRIKTHIFIILGILSSISAIYFWLKKFELLFSTNGLVFGASHTDIYAQLLNYKILFILFCFEALLLFFWAFRHGTKYPLYVFALILLSSLVFGKIYPNIIQKYIVSPNEFKKEKPFLKHNIKYTQIAYGLNKITEEQFPVDNNLTKADIEENANVINNIRLWNQEPLKQTFRQLQEIRSYYDFINIDVDRYEINNAPQQIMLSPREINTNDLPEKAQTWVNKHLTYTHGYGICMSPVNKITTNGLPHFFIKDLPPSSSINIDIKRPEIYFSEKPNDSYVIVNTKQKEFDYPKGNNNIYTHYKGSGGILLDTFTKKLVFALKFSDTKILISSLISSESRLVFDAHINTITKKIAPFLNYDEDPYLVLTNNGKLVWLIDAYTISKNFPYSEPIGKSINYIRNSVKISIDAYSGKTSFYITDENDPIIRTLSKTYKNLFLPFSEMPIELKNHIRYPKDLFNIQAHMFKIYHMNNPEVFYTKEDTWDIPIEKYDDKEQYMNSYYTITKLPNEKKDSFIIMLPYTAARKNNMIAWLSAKCDLDQYGVLKVYKFPKEKNIFGPRQIEARIDQNTDISKSLTLWGQVGSKVIRGNIMVIPIKTSLIYVEPIYLQANLPELKRVIFAYKDSVVMARDLDLAIEKTFLKQISTKPQTQSLDSEDTLKTTINKLNTEFRLFKQSAKNTNWIDLGKNLNNIDQLIQNLVSFQSSINIEAKNK